MLVIFDLDGTLLNTLQDLSHAANHALQTCGFSPISVEECCQFVGNGVTKLLERALPSGQQTPANVARLKQSFFTYYNTHLTDFTRPYPGIVEVLSALQTRGVKLAVASNKYQTATERLIQHFFPKILFVSVWGQRESIPLKPHPQVVQSIMATAGETVAHTLYVGDSEVDMQTAQNAGVKACGVTWGFRSREALAAFYPDYLIDTPRQLLTRLP